MKVIRKCSELGLWPPRNTEVTVGITLAYPQDKLAVGQKSFVRSGGGGWFLHLVGQKGLEQFGFWEGLKWRQCAGPTGELKMWEALMDVGCWGLASGGREQGHSLVFLVPAAETNRWGINVLAFGDTGPEVPAQPSPTCILGGALGEALDPRPPVGVC